jgi:hypothetical protein
MKCNQENDYAPSPDLLPFGGFEVAVLLLKLQDGGTGGNDHNVETMDFQPLPREVSSGWLRSKLMGEFSRYGSEQ